MTYQSESEQVDLLLAGGIVVTMDADGTIIHDGAVAVREGAIVAVGPAAELKGRLTAAETIDCTGHAIIPGLINGHAHVPMSLLRGVVADQQLDVWLFGYMFPIESRYVDPKFVYHGARLSCAELIRAGVTTFVDMYYFEEEVARAADEAGLRAICGQTVMRHPTPDAPSFDAGLERARAFIEAWVGHGRVIPAIAPHAPYTCTDAIYREAAALARQYGVPLVTHLAETRREVEESLQQVSRSPIAYIADLDAFVEQSIAAHCVHIDERDMALLREHGVGAVPCPTSNLKLASGVAPLAKMLESGVLVGLGTDGPASNDDQDMWTELHLAALLPKGLSGDPTAVPAAQAFAMGTSLGARAVHLDHLVGSLAAGKRADIAVVDLSGLHIAPATQYRYAADAIYTHLVYSARASDVRHVLVDGRVLLRDRELTTLDVAEVGRQAEAIAMGINAFLREREANLLDKILAIGGVQQDQIFEVQVKALLPDDTVIDRLLQLPDVQVTKASERTQYDTYLLFDDPALGRIRYREDHRLDPGARLQPKYTLTLTEPAERGDLPHAMLLSRARYTAPADRSLRFYREYFMPDRVVETEKLRRRWRVIYKGEDFAINLDTLKGVSPSGPYLEIKSRTWSQRDALHKATLIGELLRICDIGPDQLIREEYVNVM